MRDRFENLYNAETHKEAVSAEGREHVFESWLTGDGDTIYPVTLVDSDEWNGLFTFEFIVNFLHDELLLNV